MAKFYPLTVADVHKETQDCVVVRFNVPENLQQEFAFRQGQHLTLRAVLQGEDVRRTYSLCSSPLDKEWKVGIKQIPGGKFSTYANQNLKPGDVVEVMPPSGSFGVDVDQHQAKKYAAFAAGSGITPVLSIVKTILKQEPESHVQLFYLNKKARSIAFKEEIEALRNTFFGRFEIFYFLTREHRDIELFNGRFTREKIRELSSSLLDAPAVDEYFICGPEEMIYEVRDELVSLGVEKERIHYELFVTGLTEEDKKKAAQALEQRVSGTKVTIIDGGKEFHFVMSDDTDNILDGALAAGADLPFACKGGVCSTCKCRIVSGEVNMKINYALDAHEVAQNLILSCQAVPATDEVVVDFDV